MHGVKRGELHSVQDADFDARYWEAIARREAREPLQHITGRAFFRYLELQVGPGVFVPRPGDRVGRRLGHRRRPRDGRRRAADRRPVHRLRRHRARHGAGGAALPRARRGAVRGRPAVDPQERRGVQGHRAPGRRPERPPRARRPGRPGHLQPAVHPAHRVGVRRPRGPRPRPGDWPCSPARTASTPSAASSAPRTGCCAPAASSSSSTPTPRAARCRGSSPRSGAGPTRPTTPT